MAWKSVQYPSSGVPRGPSATPGNAGSGGTARRTQQRRHCTQCGKPLKEEFNFCPVCGKEKTTIRRRKEGACLCGEVPAKRHKFCRNCGREVNHAGS